MSSSTESDDSSDYESSSSDSDRESKGKHTKELRDAIKKIKGQHKEAESVGYKNFYITQKLGCLKNAV